ncbi:MAG TPA: hypothetical protein VG838_14415 [Opitutaceae bacterium]|nr:hypothetical protein [Opitutaceae bacterium]
MAVAGVDMAKAKATAAAVADAAVAAVMDSPNPVSMDLRKRAIPTPSRVATITRAAANAVNAAGRADTAAGACIPVPAVDAAVRARNLLARPRAASASGR